MCGILGLVLGRNGGFAAIELLEGLYQLQHRGQDGCGMVTAQPNGRAVVHKACGVVNDVFSSAAIKPDILMGSVGLGHVRYRTSGELTKAHAQPLNIPGAEEIFLVHNGHVMPSDNDERVWHGAHIKDSSDSEYILLVLTWAVQRLKHKYHPWELASVVLAALKSVYSSCRGAFACVAMVERSFLIGFRDPHGIKPLVFGERHSEDGNVDYMFASESIALEKLGFTNVRDVRPGEAILVHTATSHRGQSPQVIYEQVAPQLSYAPDIFEYVYFARAESIIDGISVHQCRQAMGHALAGQIKRLMLDEIDVVIPVPDTACLSALAVAQTLQKPYAYGLLKSRHSGRTFIMPGKTQRTKAIREKFNVVANEFWDKKVLIVDDSIVRGSTSREIVRIARRAGARKVIFASASPAIRFNHIHGIDLASPEQLVAYGRTEQEVASKIGADSVVYLQLDTLVKCALGSRTTLLPTSFEVGLFTGSYVDDDQKRSDSNPSPT